MSDVINTDPFGPHGFIETEVNGVFIRLTKTVDGGYTRRVWTGTNEYTGLAAGHRDAVLAARECSAIRARLIAGELARDIEADFLARNSAVLAEAAQVLADAPAPASLAAFRQGTQISATEGRVHTKPLTPAELDLIRSHVGGVVKTKPGQSWLMLRAIVRRKYGRPVHGRGTRIVAVELNQRGLDAARSNVGMTSASTTQNVA